jgi:hypothetical protein
MDKTDYPNVGKEIIIVEKTFLENIDGAKNVAIKNIMRIVDNNIDVGDKSHAHIRSVVLDEINDMAREFASMLEGIMRKLNGSE